jgi:hypothetical protein
LHGAEVGKTFFEALPDRLLEALFQRLVRRHLKMRKRLGGLLQFEMTAL